MQQNIIYKIRRLRLQFKQGCQNIKIAKSSGVSFCIQGQQSRYLAGKTPKKVGHIVSVLLLLPLLLPLLPLCFARQNPGKTETDTVLVLPVLYLVAALNT